MSVTKINSPNDPVILNQPGTYALILNSNCNKSIQIGKFGVLDIKPGFYVYIGSAFGPGGVKARLNHHFKITSRPHWYIDYLRKHVSIKKVWITYDGKRRERCWSKGFETLTHTEIPIMGFGASDHRGGSHLFFQKELISLPKFQSAVLNLAPDLGQIHQYRIG